MHQNDPALALKHIQFLSVDREMICDFLAEYSAHTANAATGFISDVIVEMTNTNQDGTLDYWDVLIAQGFASNETVHLGGLELHSIKRGFAYKQKIKALQMSGKNSRLNSKDLAKGGLTPAVVSEMLGARKDEKSLSENFYFSTGIKRRPLLVIYPVLLHASNDNDDQRKAAAAAGAPVIGLSVGVPRISGLDSLKYHYKINKQKWLEIFGADTAEDFIEVDETIPEE